MPTKMYVVNGRRVAVRSYDELIAMVRDHTKPAVSVRSLVNHNGQKIGYTINGVEAVLAGETVDRRPVRGKFEGRFVSEHGKVCVVKSYDDLIQAFRADMLNAPLVRIATYKIDGVLVSRRDTIETETRTFAGRFVNHETGEAKIIESYKNLIAAFGVNANPEVSVIAYEIDYVVVQRNEHPASMITPTFDGKTIGWLNESGIPDKDLGLNKRV